MDERALEAARLRSAGVQIIGSGVMHKPSKLTLASLEAVAQLKFWRAMRSAIQEGK